MRNKFTLSLTAALVASSLVSVAQVTTSGIRGTVVDKDGETVPGAHVEVIHVPSGTKYISETSDDGVFAVQGMRTGGPYTVIIESMGVGKKQYNDI